MNKNFLHYFIPIFILIGAGCANITAPTGGKKDTTPPKRLSISPADSLKNTRIKRLELTFNEYINVTDAAKEVQISPLLSIQPTVTGLGKKVVVKIADTLLEENTTYRISFGSSIRDLHENNPYPAYTYVFSTGSYFDSLQLSGSVINAGTGLTDSGGVTIMLYNATENDSAVVRHKPKYITKSNASGAFTFKGLPKKDFRIYAVKDINENLIYDGSSEMIGFIDHTVLPGDTTQTPIALKLFTEIDTATKGADSIGIKANARIGTKPPPDGFTYIVNADTTNQTKRTFDINNSLSVNFSKLPIVNKDKISLSYDSNGVIIVVHPTYISDTTKKKQIQLSTEWKENTLYTLRMAKGFAKDSSGTDAMPSKYTFRTKEDEDYGKISVHLPSKYNSTQFVLLVTSEKDTIYQKPITDTIINLNRLKPAKYSFRVIEDKNGNGRWDAGSLFRKIQPENVFPYSDVLTLKAGWENVVDFEPKPAPPKTSNKR